MEDLLEELVLHIFHRLPTKSIGICMCVNKYWLSLIKSPSFISSNSKIKNKNDQYLISWRCKFPFERRVKYNRFGLYKLCTLPLSDPDQIDFWLGFPSCNGLFCLAEGDGSVKLWNPIVKKLLTLPKSNYIPSKLDLNNQKHGIWFDPLTDDYKVIKIIHPYVEIFSLNSYSWKTISKIAPPMFKIVGLCLPILNGTLHWIASSTDRLYTILGFDVNAEVFRKIDLPEVLRSRDVSLTLAIYKETSIAVCSEHPSADEDAKIDFWVMTEYGNVKSWTNICTYDESKYPWYVTELPCSSHVLRCGEAFLELLVSMEPDEDAFYKAIISTDPEIVKHKELAFFHGSCFMFNSEARYFGESLVLLDNVNAINT